jgi:predicted transcriptional regulator
LEEQERVERLYFELSSESRLSILRELSKRKGKMREIARRLDLTTTEAFRQLQRLGDVLLVHKSPEGAFGVTEYGLLVLRFSSFFEFIHKNREYLSTHNIRNIPDQFLDRIGELSYADFNPNSMSNINAAERITREAEKYMWGGGVEQPLNIRAAVKENIPKGIKYRFLFPERFIPRETALPIQVAEWRSSEELPANFCMNEREAGISFSYIDGRVDYTSFIGTDPLFIGWVRDLFLYYWDRGSRL